MEHEVTEVERTAAQSVDYNDHSSCVAAVKKIMEQEYLKPMSRYRRLCVTADVMRRSTGWVERYLIFATAVPEVLDLFQMRKILAVDAEALARFPAEQQRVMAAALSELTFRSEIKGYLQEQVYANLKQLPKVKLYAEPGTSRPRSLDRKRAGEAELKNSIPRKPRLETKHDCKLALTMALETLEPLFDKPLKQIVAAFAGAPKAREEFLNNAESAQQLLSVITSAVRREYEGN